LDAWIAQVVRWVAIGLLAASLVPAAFAARNLARSRAAAYYVQRRNALGRAVRWLLAMLALLVVAVVLLIIAPALEPPATLPPASATPSATPEATDTASPAPSAVPSATPTHRPTATAPPIPTPTPSVEPPPCALTPLPSAVPAAQGARLELLALATAADANGQPVDPGRAFRAGSHPVLLFFHYQGMTTGVPVTFAWYREGEYLPECSETWLWGQKANRHWGSEGNATVTCSPGTGWMTGTYEVRVFIEARLQGVAQYVIE
jgi:hypothetical protein